MGIDQSRSRARRALVGAVVVLSVGNAAALGVHEPDGRRQSNEHVMESASTTAPPLGGPAPEAAARPVHTPQGVGPKVTAPPGSARPAAAGARSPVDFPVMSEGYEYELQLTPTCARAGEVFTAVMRVKPGVESTGTFMPFYADGSYERGGGSLAAPDGTVRYSWVARPVPGEGRLVTQAMEGDTARFGTKVVAFRVVERTRSC